MFGKWLKLVDTDGVQNLLKSTLLLPFSEAWSAGMGFIFLGFLLRLSAALRPSKCISPDPVQWAVP